MGIAPVHNTLHASPKTSFETVAEKCRQRLAQQVYCQADNILPWTFTRSVPRATLDAWPSDGPKPGPASGWQQDNRWVRCTVSGEETAAGELSSGVDWVSLHDFAQLVYAGP